MQHLQACIRHGHDTDIRLDRAEREVGSFCASLRDGIEKSTLADIRQANNTHF